MRRLSNEDESCNTRHSICYSVGVYNYFFSKGGYMSESCKSSRGGAREGAGKKNTGARGKTANLNFRLSPQELETIKLLASQAGKSVSRYLVDLALEQAAK